MNIIYIAYSCNPYNGTEDKLGWEVPKCLSKFNQVVIITKPDGKNSIERELQINRYCNIKVVYIDIEEKYKKIYKGPIYSGRLNLWHKKVLAFLDNYIQENNVDLIHQINPVEFRSIGNYGKYNDIPFVCGPVGGGEYMPSILLKYVGHNIIFEILRYITNIYYRYKYKKNGTFNNIDLLMYANEETKEFVKVDEIISKTLIMPEIGCDGVNTSVDHKEDAVFSFLFAGRLVYRKGIKLLLKSVLRVPEKYKFIINIAGSGSELRQMKKMVEKSYKLKNRVFFLGNIKYSEMNRLYERTDMLIMPSLRETTGSVVIEALAHGIPVLTQNRFGARNILNEETAFFCDLSRKPELKLANTIIECLDNRDKVKAMRNKCVSTAKNFTFERKAQTYQHIYEEIEGINNEDR